MLCQVPPRSATRTCRPPWVGNLAGCDIWPAWGLRLVEAWQNLGLGVRRHGGKQSRYHNRLERETPTNNIEAFSCVSCQRQFIRITPEQFR